MDKIEKVKGWVARDDDGTLAIHYEKPRRVCYYNNEIVLDGTPWVWENEAGYGLLPVKIFPDLKWEDEPLEVELTLKRASALSEEPDKSLEEAAEEKYPVYWKSYPKDGIVRSESSYDTNKQCRDAFIAGAEWQKSQMLKDAVDIKITRDALYTLKPFILEKYLEYKIGKTAKLLLIQEDESK